LHSRRPTASPDRFVTRTPISPPVREGGSTVSTRSRIALLLASALVRGVAAPASASGTVGARWAADAKAFEGRLIVVWKGVAPTTVGVAGVASTSPMERPWRSIVTAKPGQEASLAPTPPADPRVHGAP